MTSAILVNPKFDAIWPFAADHAHQLWLQQGKVEFVRIPYDDVRLAHEFLSRPGQIKRLLLFGVSLSQESLEAITSLQEVGGSLGHGTPWREEEIGEQLKKKRIRAILHTSEGFWGQSVAEFALALTLGALRRIPQTHHNIITSQADWNYSPPQGISQLGARGQQFGDDPNFTHGTLEGKRVRMVGAGNIASRYASFAHFLGAEVAAWDPFASEPSFHRAGTRREHFLDQLLTDAEIFVPMVPLTKETAGLVTASHIEALPKGTLVILVTRAGIVDMAALRRRVMNDELALAADVFDQEPLMLDDPLLGRHNVIHTPHNAGRTRTSNERFVEMLIEKFTPIKQ